MEPEEKSPSKKPFSAWANPAVNSSAADSPHDPTHRQNAPGDHTLHAVWKYHRADHSPLACPQAECTLPVGLGNRFQTFLGGTHDGGQIHNDQCQRTRQQTFVQVHKLTEEQAAEQTVNDGGNTGQGFRCVFNHAYQPLVRGVLGQLDRCAHTQWQHKQQRGQNNVEGVENIRQDTNCSPQITGLGGQ